MDRAIKLVGGLVAVTAVLLFTACSSSKETKNAPAALVEFKPTLPVKIDWVANVGASAEFVFHPAFVGNSILAAAANGNLVRIDSGSGREIWRVQAPSPLTAGVGAYDTTAAVVGEKGMLFAYSLEGQFRWKVQVSSEVLSAPAVGGGLVVVRSMDNRITAYDSGTGKLRWIVERASPSLILRSAGGMAIADNTVFVGLPGGKLIAIALANGSVRWEAVVGEPRGATELERVADVSGSPVVVGSDVCASAYQGKVACFDIRTGGTRWNKALSSSRGVDADERFVFAVDDKSSVYAFSRRAGLTEWKSDQLAYRRLSTPASVGQAVAFADMRGYVHFLSRQNGSFLARVSTDDSAIVAPPVLAGTNVVVQTQAGKIVALTIE